MQIITINKDKGLTAIFNGYGEQAYVIHSSFYGFIGYANILDECGSHDITIDLYLGDISSAWERIIKIALSKSERQFVEKNITWKVTKLDRYVGDTRCYEKGIGRPECNFTIKLDNGVKAVSE